MALDFESSDNGIWTKLLDTQSATYAPDHYPQPRDIVLIGGRQMFLCMRNSFSPGEYVPPPREGIDGWFGLGRGSEIWNHWNAFYLEEARLVLLVHHAHRVPSWVAGRPSNAVLRLDPYHTGSLWLARPGPIKREKQVERLREAHLANASIAFLRNTSIIVLPQQAYDKLFYGSNLHHNGRSHLPSHIHITEGVKLSRRSWVTGNEGAAANTMSVTYNTLASRSAEFGVKQPMIIELGSPVLREYSLYVNSLSSQVVFLHISTVENLNAARLWLLLGLILCWGVWMIARPNQPAPPPGTYGRRLIPQTMDRLRNALRFRMSWALFAGVYGLSVALAITTFWTSNRLFDLPDEQHGTLVYIATVISIHVFLAVVIINFALFWVSASIADEQERLNFCLDVYLITKASFCILLLQCAWVVTLERTSTDFANIAGAAVLMFLVFICTILALELLVWFSTPPSFPRRRFLFATLYAVAFILWMIVYTTWIYIQTLWLGLVELLSMNIPEIGSSSQWMMSVTVVMMLAIFGIQTATPAIAMARSWQSSEASKSLFKNK